MQAIYKQSGPLADTCEFQVHYWALVFRHQADDSSILDIAIPLVYFNYKQTVSGGRIDFDMKEVSELSTKLLPITQMEAGKVLATSFKADIESTFGVTFTPLLTELNTIHKHPGGSSHQSFSGTDLDTNPNDHGVVYPLASAKNNVPNFAGIMALDSKVNNTAHFEYRLVNGTLGTDIKYTQGRCIALTVKPPQTLSGVEKIMGYQTPPAFKVNAKYSEGSNINEFLVNLYRSMNYKPFLKAIVPENVVKAVSTYNPSTKSHWGSRQQDFFDFTPNVIHTVMPEFHEEITLKSMKPPELIEYLKVLDAYMLDRDVNENDYAPELYPSKADIIDEILDVQINILAEQPLPRADLENELVHKGFSRSTLATKSYTQLEYLYGF